jgi:hypothetical protein
MFQLDGCADRLVGLLTSKTTLEVREVWWPVMTHCVFLIDFPHMCILRAMARSYNTPHADN